MTQFKYSIGTLVTSPTQYAQMRASFVAHGFTEADCEYLIIDNARDKVSTGAADVPQTSAFAGLNQLLNRASAPYVILCHQDIVLLEDGRAVLDQRLAEITALDSNWALAGNSGCPKTWRVWRHISDPHGDNQNVGTFPHRVMSLDENFMVVRRDTRVGFSRDLTGFHFYGADICLNADILGYSTYVIDFHLRHLSAGKIDATFWAAEGAFVAKWRRALRDRLMQTPCTLVAISGQPYPLVLRRLRERVHRRIARWQISLEKRWSR